MKTNIEINGYVIEVSEENGVVSVVATKDEEVVNEFTLEEAQEEAQGEESQMAGEEFAQAEDDFADAESEDIEADIDLEEVQEGVVAPVLLSFNEFCEANKK